MRFTRPGADAPASGAAPNVATNNADARARAGLTSMEANATVSQPVAPSITIRVAETTYATVGPVSARLAHGRPRARHGARVRRERAGHLHHGARRRGGGESLRRRLGDLVQPRGPRD